MRKILIGAIVGGLIIFIWQFLSFALINFHRPAQNYTDKQERILSFLNSQQLKEGGYILPSAPENASMEDHEKLMNSAFGKPWAMIQYHHSQENNMAMNMIRGFLVNFIIVLLFCWLIRRMNAPSAGTIVTSALAVGLIVFMNAPYTSHIWYQSFDIWAYLGDAVVSWGLTGLWLGWWLRREKIELSTVTVNKPVEEMAH
jgi:F0F1-type ATP synthase assembly protein I